MKIFYNVDTDPELIVTLKRLCFKEYDLFEWTQKKYFRYTNIETRHGSVSLNQDDERTHVIVSFDNEMFNTLHFDLGKDMDRIQIRYEQGYTRFIISNNDNMFSISIKKQWGF